MKSLRFFQAKMLYPVHVPPISNGIVVVDSENSIVDIINPAKVDYNIQDIIKYSGSILPGLVNSHCHLELSHLEGKIKKNKGFGNFLQQVFEEREKNIENKTSEAIKRSKQNGIVAIGDICNGISTLKAKQNENDIHFVNFIEVFGTRKEKNTEILEKASFFKQKFSEIGDTYIVPHSLYSVNSSLLKQVGDLDEKISTIHHYETKNEERFLKDRSGEIHTVYEKNNIPFSGLKHKNSFPYLVQRNEKNTLLVHNGYMPFEVKEEMKELKNTYLCLCPLSNIYVDGSLPNIPEIANCTKNITLGTDSLATNTRLDIISEIKTIKRMWKGINFAELLKWATLNGAKALGIDDTFGSFEKGRKPSGFHVQNFEKEKEAHIIKKIF